MEQEAKGEPRPWNDSRTRTAEPAPSAPKPVPGAMPKTVERNPTLSQRWRMYQPSKSTLLWACIASIALTILVGFMWGGWTTAGSAQRSATVLSAAAVVDRLAPVCFSQFNLDPDATAKRTEMIALSSSQASKFVQDQGWATIAGSDSPDRRVADACSKLILATGS